MLIIAFLLYSVTKSRNCFFTFLAVYLIKICQMPPKIPNVALKFKILKKPEKLPRTIKIWPKWRNLATLFPYLCSHLSLSNRRWQNERNTLAAHLDEWMVLREISTLSEKMIEEKHLHFGDSLSLHQLLENILVKHWQNGSPQLSL